ncbi:MAG: hypothetical protein AAFN77_10600 [Planctomycetota bacterium]
MLHRMLIAATLCCCCLAMTSGCAEPEQEEQNESIINQKTQDIQKADPNAKQADLQVKKEDGLKAFSGAYGFAISEISKNQIKQMVELYRAEHGEYPKDYDTFMAEIIEKYNIELPVLPGGRKYQYDVENHELIVVEAVKQEK